MVSGAGNTSVDQEINTCIGLHIPILSLSITPVIRVLCRWSSLCVVTNASDLSVHNISSNDAWLSVSLISATVLPQTVMPSSTSTLTSERVSEFPSNALDCWVKLMRNRCCRLASWSWSNGRKESIKAFCSLMSVRYCDMVCVYINMSIDDLSVCATVFWRNEKYAKCEEIGDKRDVELIFVRFLAF